MLFHLLPDNANFNGASVSTFLRYVQRRVSSQMTLIWDAVPFHCSAPVEDFLASNSRISIETFPPYASELNPVDAVWAYVKYGRLANYAPTDLLQLRRQLKAEMARLQERADLLHAFVRRAQLSLDL